MEVSKTSRKQTISLLTLGMLLLAAFTAGWLQASSAIPKTAPVNAPPPATTATTSIVPTNVTDHSIAAGAPLKYNVTIANAPSLTGFDIWVSFDSRVLTATASSVSFSGNILSKNPSIISTECINGKDGTDGGCGNVAGLNGPGVVNLGMAFQGNYSTPSATNGLLFQITVTVNNPDVSNPGATQLLLEQVVLTSPDPNQPVVPSFTRDGFFTNRYCTDTTLCSHPVANFTYSPVQPSIGTNVTFSAGGSKSTNPGGQVATYEWDWGGEICKSVASLQVVNYTIVGGRFTPPNSTIYHVFCNAQVYNVILRVIDSYGIAWAIVVPLPVRFVYIDVTVSGLVANPFQNVEPGTVVEITANILNNSTLPSLANLTLTIDTMPPKIWNKTFSLSPRGILGSNANAGQLGPVPWDTTGLAVRAYRVSMAVTSNLPQNVTTDKTLSTFIQLIVPQQNGLLSLNLLQSSGLGILVIFALVAGLARFRKKPSWQTEALIEE